MESWNSFLKRYKRDHKLSQLKLAERLGMTQGGVGHWLRGTRRPTLETINEKLEKLGLVFLEAQVMVVERDIVPEAPLYASFRFPVLGWSDLQGPLPETSKAREQTDYMPAGNAFWLVVESDSMNAASGKSVPEGMRVLVDTGLPAEPGRLVIARQPGRPPVLRQLVEEGGDKMLKPLNTRYPTVLCEDGCEFLGVVVRMHAAL
ncbi:helix-turn-helix domain-containing protein [Pseudomonas sp. CM25]|uniref:LexA family protein n=1 Tax=unclassified Pseudomonas TaxID=196821 RepID=UPI0015573D4E|nr:MULTISPECIES: S24 family peptidase [unclassified Pseudomonas]NQD55268.1 helix-turn-helix domain-containing protein [Pseudomonas sp. CM25]NQD77843.1 helix-turn-helix domain-containing protein [Pseudomonas sp. CM27]HEN8799871.1 helix-turn-helix domain-containing protein [Pseudomonas putida]